MLVRAVSLSSKNGALKNVSFDLPEASVAIVVGANGSGKSTLARLIWGQEEPAVGGCWLYDQPVSARHRATLQQMRRRAGVIFQRDCLLENETALQNVLVALEIVSPHAPNLTAFATEALLRVGFSASLHARARDLSAGQRRLVAVARAVCTNPSLVVADEPTAELGGLEAERVLELLSLMQKNGTGLLIASADPRVTSFAQTASWPIYRLVQGEILPIFPGASQPAAGDWSIADTVTTKSHGGLVS